MKARAIGGLLIVVGLISLWVIAASWPASATGVHGTPSEAPKTMPYPDPSRGGPGTRTPRVSPN